MSDKDLSLPFKLIPSAFGEPISEVKMLLFAHLLGTSLWLDLNLGEGVLFASKCPTEKPSPQLPSFQGLPSFLFPMSLDSRLDGLRAFLKKELF